MEFVHICSEVLRLWPPEIVLEIIPSTGGRYSVRGLIDLEDSVEIDKGNILMVCMNKAVMGVVHDAARSVVRVNLSDIRVAEIRRKFEDDLRWYKEGGVEYLSAENASLIERYLGVV